MDGKNAKLVNCEIIFDNVVTLKTNFKFLNGELRTSSTANRLRRKEHTKSLN